MFLLRLTGVLTAAALLLGSSVRGALADGTDAPAPAQQILLVQATPSPAPATPDHRHRLTISGDTNLTIIDQNYIGSGLYPLEGAAFQSGLPIAPGTPYDFFSAAPTSSGFGLGQNIKLNVDYGPAGVLYGVTLGFGSLSGSANTVGYWGEQPIPTLNPHIGMTAMTLPITANPFPTKPGLDDVSGVRGSLLGGHIKSKDGNYSFNAGWLDLEQTQNFVFKQAAVTNSSPALAVVLPDSIGSGAPTLDDWLPSDVQLPLLGFDAYAKMAGIAYEATVASLPDPSGVGARLNNFSAVWDRNNGTRFAAQYAGIRTGGNAILTTTDFGAPVTFAGTGQCSLASALPASIAYSAATPILQPTSATPGQGTYGQGNIPFTCLNGQQNQVFGASGTGTLFTVVDGVAEVGFSTYSQAQALGASGNTTGTYLHGGLTQHLGSLAVTEDYYSVDPRYAPTILPYGASSPTENIWSAAYTWPAQWLRGDYQSIDNSQAYNDRHGYKFGVDYETDPLQVRVKYSVLSQLYPITTLTGTQPGFVEGYYLPEIVAAGAGGGNLGIDREFAAWVALHPKVMDVSLEYVTQNNYRPMWNSPLDVVAMNYPQVSVTLSKKFNDKFLLAGGFSDFLVQGTWAGSGVNMNQGVTFIGFQFLKSQSQQFMLQARYYNTQGLPPLTDNVNPTLRGMQFTFEQKAKI